MNSMYPRLPVQPDGTSPANTAIRVLDLADNSLAASEDLPPMESVERYRQAAKELTLDLRRQLCDQNLFVFHLPSQWDEEDLRREFMRFGSILTARVVKRPDGTSKGYGFVCFTENSSACRAMEVMNGKSFAGKRLKVSLKKTPEECLHLQVQKLMEISNANQPYDRNRDCTLFVFHVPSAWQDEDMYYHFHTFGTLLTAKIAKRSDNMSRGYGFVTYDSPRGAALAIANMNGVDVGANKRLKVQLKQQSNPPQPSPESTIFIFHLPSDWTDNHLRQHFEHYGKILGAIVQRDSGGNAKGYGFVSFDRPQSALNAVLGMNGFSVGHKRLKVSLKRGDYSVPPLTTLSSNPSSLVSAANPVTYWQPTGVPGASCAALSPSRHFAPLPNGVCPWYQNAPHSLADFGRIPSLCSYSGGTGPEFEYPSYPAAFPPSAWLQEVRR